MIPSTAILTSALSVQTVYGAYSLVDTYNKTNFFDGFNFSSGHDPTHGHVQYVDAETANSDGYAGYHGGAVYMGVDSAKQAPNGRESVRLESKKQYTKGLFVLDIAHMPTSKKSGCGVWPAWWMFGPDWPTSGEIDIIEGVNSMTSNSFTMHTDSGCSLRKGITLAGTRKGPTEDCHQSTGCGQTLESSSTYGKGLNDAGGAIVVTEWTKDAITLWFLDKSQANLFVADATPDPASFGTPAAQFVGGSGCDIDKQFKNHKLVFDTTFCGDWAGKVWDQFPTCSALGDCKKYVSENPTDFDDTFWLVNSIKIYQCPEDDAAESASSAPATYAIRRDEKENEPAKSSADPEFEELSTRTYKKSKQFRLVG